MRNSKSAPKVNAGSMADIAFLLLIFFLVTTTISSDTGINRKLPRLCPPNQDCNVDIHERNIMRIKLNGNQEIMVEEEIIAIEDLKQKAITFINNNGDKSCDYCTGSGQKSLSDNPQKAVISLQSHPLTSYKLFISVQDELTKAYHDLRANYAQQYLNKNMDDLSSNDLKLLREVYPFIISEALTK